MLPLSERVAYWRSLIRQEPVDVRLAPGLIEELRAALRDALHEIPQPQPESNHWRKERVGKC
ncbi:MAG: hypothetical protein PHO57_02970 [Acidithiobacillus sp.]|jgi:hypothetical protein|nr:hypothetical protein [Acidithiobacillus sp.]